MEGTIVMNERIKCEKYLSKVMTADEAAKLIYPGATIGLSGFTPAGHAKAVPLCDCETRGRNGRKT